MNSNFTDTNSNITAPQSLLDSVAQAYTENFDDLSRFKFVFPNKRAGRFFLNAVAKAAGDKNMVAPEVTTIQDFVEQLSGRILTGKIDLLFRLFNIWRSLPGYRKESDNMTLVEEFEFFRGMGETMVADFSEVDQYDIDPDALFKNVADFREIATDYLSDEQKKVLEQYFGEHPSEEAPRRFWKNFHPVRDESEIKKRFLSLWQKLPELYHRLTDELEREGLATSGSIYRLALANLRDARREGIDAPDLFGCDKLVFVGFNALSTTEALIFETITKIGGYTGSDERDRFADFYWDTPGPVLGKDFSDAAKFQRLNRANFPEPDWAQPYLELSEVATLPDITVAAAPSNAAQTKIAALHVREFLDKYGVETLKSARCAVVLPDENLLLPLLYALPEDLGAVNLTMGYPLRLTSIAAFMHHLSRLNARSKTVRGVFSFMTEDLSALMSSPLSHSLFGTENIASLNSFLARRHRIFTPFDDLRTYLGPNLDLLNFNTAEGSTESGIAFLDNILANIDASLGNENSGVVKSSLDRSHVKVYRDALRLLRSATREHNIPLDLKGVFQFADKLLSGERVSFEGEPLVGLQVMGMLETRVLDFEHLIILSLNDKVMPRKSRRATFIPDTLRHGYGMPSSNYQERLFSYYFYRMIARACTVTLVYDARAGEGMRSGGESRYLMQLRYLHAYRKLHTINYHFLLNDINEELQPIEKTSEVLARLQKFTTPGSGFNLSASALKKYCECPVRFYYEVICKIRTDLPDGGYISAATQGTIAHEVMMQLYVPKEDDQRKFLSNRILITADKIDQLVAQRLDREVVRAVNRHHFNLPKAELDTPLTGTVQMAAKQIRAQILDILTYDKTLTPFEIAGVEIGGTMQWEFAPGRTANMKYSIDRMDILNPGTHREEWRVIDYKTGKAHVTAKEFEDIFNGNSDAKNILQLQLYCQIIAQEHNLTQPLHPYIYEVGSIRIAGPVRPTLAGAPLPPVTLDDAAQPLPTPSNAAQPLPTREAPSNAAQPPTDAAEPPSTRSALNTLITGIFDPMESFVPTDDPDNCRYCTLRALCRR